ncbi:hypothetical protein V8E36_008098 [Tilletia maclaganii]
MAATYATTPSPPPPALLHSRAVRTVRSLDLGRTTTAGAQKVTHHARRAASAAPALYTVTKTTSFPKRGNLPTSRSLPTVAQLQYDASDNKEDYAMLSTATGTKMDSAWLDLRGGNYSGHSSSPSSGSVNGSGPAAAAGSISCSSSQSGRLSPWSGSNFNSPKLDDCARMGPPAPWETTATADVEMQEATEHDHLASLARALALSTSSSSSPLTASQELNIPAAPGLLPPAPVDAISSALSSPGAMPALLPSVPMDPTFDPTAGMARRVPLAEIPLWYADVRGEYLRRIKQERSSLSNVVDFSQNVNILSVNRSDTSTSSSLLSRLDSANSSFTTQSPDSSMTSAFASPMQQTLSLIDETASTASQGSSSNYEEGNRLFVLADEPYASPRRKEMRNMRKKSISDQQNERQLYGMHRKTSSLRGPR